MPNDTNSPQETDSSPIDRGLAEAFGGRPPAPDPGRPHASVLEALQERTGSVLALHLNGDESDGVPVMVTDEVRELRDPSGRYQLVGELGRGGIGVVYKGRDQDLGRDVAMKVLRDDYAQRPDVLARFVEEAQIGGQLQHPGIVPVYELGLQAGERPYIAMKLVKGETLAAQLARRNDPSEDRRRILGIFEQVCQTVAYAHARRVVHRDLKPANVMIGAFGEVQVVDWGLAKVLPKGGVADERETVARATERSVIETVRSGSGSESVAGCMLGTPPYMPPEQAQGDMWRVDERSDVFALGAILCEILTGVPPYLPLAGDVIRQAATTSLDGAHKRLAECDADASLVELCIECMSPARRARPASASEVAERVGAYLTSVEERAHQAELRATEARYKHRVTLVSSAAAFLILALGVGVWATAKEAAASRRDEARQRVEHAMNAVSDARGEARHAGDDVEHWTAAAASAGQLEKLLESADVETGARAMAKQLVAEVRSESKAAHQAAEQRKRDEEMLARLRDVRIPMDDDVSEADWEQREWDRLDQAYTGAFSWYLGGRSLFELSDKGLFEQLRRGPRIEFAACLDHWGLVRDGLADKAERAGTALIRELARRLDPDNEWRRQLRELLPNAKREGKRLLEFAKNANLESLSPASCRVLSQALEFAGEKDAVLDVLRKSLDAHPKDFDLCFSLGIHLERATPCDWQGAAAYYAIAHALEPEHTETLHRLGIALFRVGRTQDSLLAFQRLHHCRPDNLHWYLHLGMAHAQIGDTEAAMRCYRGIIAKDDGYPGAHMNLADLLLAQDKFAQALAEDEKAYAEFSAGDPAIAVRFCPKIRLRVAECRRSLPRADRERPKSSLEWVSAIVVASRRHDDRRVVALAAISAGRTKQSSTTEPRCGRTRTSRRRTPISGTD